MSVSLVKVHPFVAYFPTTNSTPLLATLIGPSDLSGRVVIDCGPTGYPTPYDRDTRIVWRSQIRTI